MSKYTRRLTLAAVLEHLQEHGAAPQAWAADSWRRPSGPSSLEHVYDIRGTGRIGKQDVLQRVCPDATAHGHRQDIDHLVGMRSKEMSTEDALAPFFD